MLILDKTRINILVDVNFLIPTFQVVLIHINKVGNRINKVGHETTKWVNESTKWVNESTSWMAPNQPRGLRQLYVNIYALQCDFMQKNRKKHPKNQNRWFYYVNLAPELRNDQKSPRKQIT